MTLPWCAPPYLTPTSSDVIDIPRDQRTPEEIATYLKRRFLPHNLSGKRQPEIRWVTTCLTSEPTEESAPRYADWEASSFLHVVIDILTHGDGIRHSGFEGQTRETSRSLLVLVACALQYMHKSGTSAPLDPSTIEDIADAFSFNEIRKRSLHTRFCSAPCDTVSDKDLLLNCGGIILPMAKMTPFLTFAPTADESIRTSLPKEIRLALTSHKTLFTKRGWY